MRRFLLPTVAALAMVAGAAPARAQLLDQFLPPDVQGVANEAGVTVLSRRRPDYDPLGIRAGSFMIRPEVTEGVGYESNVLGTKRARGSAVVESHAALEATSDVSRATVRAALRVDDTRYLDLPSQSFTNWSATLGGSYEIGRDTLSASFAHLNLNQTSRDLDVPQLNQAITYRIDTGRLDYKIPFNRVFVQPSIEVARYEYGSGAVLDVAGGGAYSQSYRDRVVVTPGATLGYDFSPRRTALAVVRNSIASYDRSSPGLPRRDYNDAAVLAGLDYDLNGLLRFRILGGYEIRTFSAAAYKTIGAPVVEGSVFWTPTGLTTVTGTVQRRILDSADESTVGFTETSLRLRVDHEYRRNVLLHANAGAYLGEYGRGGTSQVLTVAGAGASYQLNRNIRLSGDYDFQARTSGGGNGTLGGSSLGGTSVGSDPFGSGTQLDPGGRRLGSGYTDHRVMFRIRFQL